HDPLFFALGLSIFLVTLLNSSFKIWYGGHSFGPEVFHGGPSADSDPARGLTRNERAAFRCCGRVPRTDHTLLSLCTDNGHITMPRWSGMPSLPTWTRTAPGF